MTLLIDRQALILNLYFTFDRPIVGAVTMEVAGDYHAKKNTVNLDSPTVENTRYTLFTVDNPFSELLDGLYSYSISDSEGILKEGSLKIQSDDFGANQFKEFEEDGDDIIVVED
ncbi:hypothetical protein [Sphingobacterium daejeonense]|uniref:hypothetical protein n=1 Tax=Sphingobacterium daejeonense TaxID=371142 RepID=UPI0010C475B5|nr:hypothetical protein [Sphingobacterium daejeonense]VTP97732.1 Uncharacterised protein [Sphingobacterium daejeonense]